MVKPETLNLGRYRIVEVLGRSHYATVYDAHDTKSGDRVAVKVLSLAGSHRNIAEAMFRKEVGALRGFTHPAVVRLLDDFSEPEADRLGIVLELVPGGRTLEHLIADVRAAREPRRSLRWRLEQLAALLDGLDSAHRRKVIHRDVKLANVLVERDQNALKLADFGIARLLENYGRGEAGATLREFYTRPFAAPEQVLHGDAGFAADLHAFGLVAASLLAWQVPAADFKRTDLPELLAPLQNEIRDPDTFQQVQTCLDALLATEPSQRPRTHAVARLLRVLLERTAERSTISIRLTTTARDRGRESGCSTDAALLADLNDGLRARYEQDKTPRTDTESFVIRCYGRGLWAQLVPDQANPERLVVVAVGRNPPNIHAHQRERALSVPFNLAVGNDSAGPLVDFLFKEYLAERQREDEKRRKESLLEVAKFILARQRERILNLCIRYRAAVSRTERRSDRTKNSDSVTGQDATRTPEEDYFEPRGEFLRIEVLEVLSSQSDEDVEQPGDLADTWAEGLDNRASFFLDGERFATFHGYDRATRILSLRLQQRRKLRREGEIECKDIAMETALKRQESALDHFFEDDCVNPNLGRLLLYPEENHLAEVLPRPLIQDLQPRQAMQSLVERVLAAQDFFFVQGPPGTGKTTVIAEVMAQILSQHPDARILLTSQANEAVNNALEALRDLAQQCKAEWRMVRDVRTERAERDSKIGFEAVFREWVERTRQHSAQALSDQEPTLAAGQLGAIREALRNWSERLDRVEDVREDYAESVQVFGVTCLRVPTLWRMLREVRFDWVIVDEAAKATPAEVLVSLVVGRRFVLVGDHRQLPPFLDTETEQEIASANLDVGRARRSLFEELFDKIPQSNRETLRRQFRMHRSIGTFVGDLFYDDLGGLETGVPDSERTLALSRFDQAHRVFWLDVDGREIPDGTSYWNQQEVDLVLRLLQRFERELRERGTNYKAGVIAPYAAQIQRLQRTIMPSTQGWSALQVEVNTVDAFQGKQADLIVYSLVRVGEGEKRFLSDRRRLNVAFSRAQRLLVLVGHRKSATHSPRLAHAVELIPSENIWSAEDVL
jgi:serine/threonine protein kinase